MVGAAMGRRSTPFPVGTGRQAQRTDSDLERNGEGNRQYRREERE